MHICHEWSGGVQNDNHRQNSSDHGLKRFSADSCFSIELRKRQTCCSLPIRLVRSKIPARRYYSTIPRKDKDHRQLHATNIHELPSAGMVDEQSLRVSWFRLLDLCQPFDCTQSSRGGQEPYQPWVGHGRMHSIDTAGSFWEPSLASESFWVYRYTETAPEGS